MTGIVYTQAAGPAIGAIVQTITINGTFPTSTCTFGVDTLTFRAIRKVGARFTLEYILHDNVSNTDVYSGSKDCNGTGLSADDVLQWNAGSGPNCHDTQGHAFTLTLKFHANDPATPSSGGFVDFKITTASPVATNTWTYADTGITPAYNYYRLSVAPPAGDQYDVVDWASDITYNVEAVQVEWHVGSDQGGDLAPGSYTTELRVGTAVGGSNCADLTSPSTVLFNASGSAKTALLCPHLDITSPSSPTPDTEPSDLPPPDSYPCSTIADLCTLLNWTREDIQHLFAAISSTDDRIDALTADVDTRLAAIAITAGDALSAATSADTNAGVAADRAAVLLTDVSEILDPPANLLATHSLVAGDNDYSLPAHTTLIEIALNTVPTHYGYTGNSPKHYERLGYVSITSGSGHTTITWLHWQTTAVSVIGTPNPTALHVWLMPDIAGTINIYGRA